MRRRKGAWARGQSIQQLCQQWYCQDIRRKRQKVQDSAGDCSCQEATADGVLDRERIEETGAKQS